MRQSRVQLGKRVSVHLLDHGASCQSNVDDIVRGIGCVPSARGRTACCFPDSEVFATRHDGCDFMLPNSIAMSMVLKRMLGNEIPEFLQIIRCNVSLLGGEIERFVQAAIMLRQKRLPFSVYGRCENMVTICSLLKVVLRLGLDTRISRYEQLIAKLQVSTIKNTS
jgi:hypothetical protein